MLAGLLPGSGLSLAHADISYVQLTPTTTSDGWSFSGTDAATFCTPGEPAWFSADASDLIIGSSASSVSDCFRATSGSNLSRNGANWHVDLKMWCGSTLQTYQYFGWAPNHTQSFNTDSLLGACTSGAYFTKLQILDHTTQDVLAEWTGTGAGPPPPSVSLTTSSAQLATGETATLTATASKAIPTGSALEIFDDAGAQIAIQHSGTTMTYSIPWAPAPRSYTAYIATTTTSSPPTGTTLVASSSPVTINPAPWNVSLTASSGLITTAQTASLTATVNQGVVTPYVVEIFDNDGTQLCVQHSGTSMTCAATWNPAASSYVAYVGTTSTTAPPTGATLLAQSDPVPVQSLDWTVNLATDKAILASPETATLTAAADQPMANTGYAIQIFDETTGERVCRQTDTADALSCSVTWNATPHAYRAYVATLGTSDPPPNEQAESDPVMIEPLSGSASLSVNLHSWLTDASQTTYDISASGFGLASGVSTGTGPCATTSCTWQLTITYTGSDGLQHSATLGTGTIDAGRDSFATDLNGNIDLSGATDVHLSLTLTPTGSDTPALQAGGLTGTISGDILDSIDVDEAFASIVAAYNAGTITDPCNKLLFVAGTHTAGTSTSDQYNDCEAATAAGTVRLTLQGLKDLARRWGSWILLTLSATVPDTTTVPPQPDPTQVTVTVGDGTVQRLGEIILSQSQGKITNESDAEVAARQCLQYLNEVGGSLPSPATCDDTPIFFPGGDNPATTANDYDGIFLGRNTRGGAPNLNHMMLRYKQLGREPGTWKNGMSQCQGATVLMPCDEYPFISTMEGADPDTTALALVPRSQNSSEGGYLGAFYRRCQVSSADGKPFLVVPMTMNQAPPTLYTCG